MNSKERFYATLAYQTPDRFPTKHYGTPEINRALMDHFGLTTHEELLCKVGDDFRHVEPRYIGPELRTFPDGSWEGLWGERYANWSFGGGTYPEAIYLPFAEIDDPAVFSLPLVGGEPERRWRFPSPDWYDYSQVKADAQKLAGTVVCTGGAGVPDFMNGIARCRGVEKVLLDIGEENPAYLALMEQRFEFFYEMYRRVLEAAEGAIDVLCLGEDYGNQNGLMISPRKFDKLFAPKMKAFFDLAHRYGAKAMMHCCGSNRQLIPRLIELGLDILEVVQVDAAGMNINELHEHFYGKLAFCGSISVQNTLPWGTVEDVVREVELRQRLFARGGMIIAATHDIQVGTPIENIVAMYRTIGSLQT
jgi:uroporphyrinogen decarboxylase